MSFFGEKNMRYEGKSSQDLEKELDFGCKTPFGSTKQRVDVPHSKDGRHLCGGNRCWQAAGRSRTEGACVILLTLRPVRR